MEEALFPTGLDSGSFDIGLCQRKGSHFLRMEPIQKGLQTWRGRHGVPDSMWALNPASPPDSPTFGLSVTWTNTVLTYYFLVRGGGQNSLFYLYIFGCETLALGLRIKPMPYALEAWRLNHWTAREIPYSPFFCLEFYLGRWFFLLIATKSGTA